MRDLGSLSRPVGLHHEPAGRTINPGGAPTPSIAISQFLQLQTPLSLPGQNALKHGRFTLEKMAERRRVSELLRQSRKFLAEIS
jgi:hypothetical protein